MTLGRLVAAVVLLAASLEANAAEPLRIAVFHADATPPLGSPVAYAPARSIEDPLTARGVILLTDEKPIVLCAVDWIGIANGGHDAWRRRLAEAAGTTKERVSVHALHQHDGARCDFTAEQILAQEGHGGEHYDLVFCRETIEQTAKAVREAIDRAEPVTHLGLGKAKVEKVASQRRVLGDDGKVKITRWSRTTNPAAIEAPEGLIDPYVRLISFWQNDKPLAVLAYYATHPMSYYGQGDVSADFVGLARQMREEATDATHVYFTGAAGNITAGKYNDGSPKMRPILAKRLAKGMRKAWKATEKQPISAEKVAWRAEKIALPIGEHLKDREALQNMLDDADTRLTAAKHLAFAQRSAAGEKITLGCLQLGDDAYVIHLPGELFIEYQLAAQEMRPDDFVATAAYADYGPGYIGTEISYTQGGYETSQRASRVSPEVEGVLMEAMEELLKD